MKVLPYYWPTMKLFVDDDLMFLDALSGMLQNKNYIFESNCFVAKELISNSCFNFDWYLNTSKTEELVINGYQLNFSLIKDIKLDKTRYNIFSTVIVDYHMPQMSGTDFCMMIGDNSGIRKILLTGGMEQQDAINHLNCKNIDSFISKPDLNEDAMAKLIAIEEYNFFKNSAWLIYNGLDSKNPILLEEFRIFFNKIIAKYNIREWYLLNEMGFFLLIDKKNVEMNLFFFAEEDIIEMYDEGKSHDLSSEILQNLQNFSSALCYYSEDLSWPKVSDWHKYIESVERVIINSKKYYYKVNIIKNDN